MVVGPVSSSASRRNRLYVAVGVVVEWYDFMIYGLLATTIQAVFYPVDNAATGLILTFATFAVGYLARPIGGIVLGRLGDTRGRKFALVLATGLMLVPLLVTTVLPGYAVLGVWAPLLLTLMRFLQGFSVGGEFTGALTALSESSDASSRGRSVSIGLATAMCGALLASLVVMATASIWGQAALADGTWRIPYVIGLLLAIVSVLLQRRMQETDSFETAKRAGDTGRPLASLLREHPMAMLLMFALAAWSGVTIYTLISWLPTYLETVIGLSDVASDATSAFISAVYMVLVVPAALIGDRLGRRRLMFIAVGLYVLLSVPAYALIGTRSLIPILLSMVVLATMQVCVDSSATTEMTDLLPTRVRYTGLALTYSLGMIVVDSLPRLRRRLGRRPAACSCRLSWSWAYPSSCCRSSP